MPTRNGEELPRILPFTAFNADFIDARSLPFALCKKAQVDFTALYQGAIKETNADPKANEPCKPEECEITTSHIDAYRLARESDPTLEFDLWLRKYGARGKYQLNLGLANFQLFGFDPNSGDLVAGVSGVNVRIEKSTPELVFISVKMFTAWSPTPQLTRVQRDARMQRWLLENNFQTPTESPDIDIVEIRHYREEGIRFDSKRHPAFDTEFWSEIATVADEIKESADERVEAIRRKTADIRPPLDPDINP